MLHLPASSAPALVSSMRPILALSIFVVLVACGKDGASGAARGGAGKTIAVLLPTRSTQFWQQFEAGVQEAAKRGDYKLRVESADLDVSRQRALVERIVRDGAHALVLASVDPLAAAPWVKQASGARIPVFTAGLEVPGATVIAHVASDDDAGGELAAMYIRSFLKDSAEVGIVGLPGTPAGDARERGFRRALASTRTMPVVAAVSGGGTRESARAATEALITANPQIDALFVTSEAHTLGALDATRGRWQELVIVGYGLSSETAKSIAQESPLKAVVQESPREMGIRTVQVVAEHLSNEGVPMKLTVGVRLVTAGTVASAVR